MLEIRSAVLVMAGSWSPFVQIHANSGTTGSVAYVCVLVVRGVYLVDAVLDELRLAVEA